MNISSYRTQDDEEMSAFVRYCARYDPSFSNSIVGASEVDLARLRALAGLALPPEYEAFYRAMGRSAPSSLGKFLAHFVFGVDAVTNYYEHITEPIPDNAVYLCTQGQQFDFFLSIEVVAGFRPVLQFSWPFSQETGELIPSPPGVITVTRSLMQFLYQEAFTQIRLPALAYHMQLRENVHGEKPDSSDTDERRALFLSITERLGFKQVPYMNDGLLFLDRADAAAGLFCETYATDLLYLAASSETELHRLVEIFGDNLDFSRW